MNLFPPLPVPKKHFRFVHETNRMGREAWSTEERLESGIWSYVSGTVSFEKEVAEKLYRDVLSGERNIKTVVYEDAL